MTSRCGLVLLTGGKGARLGGPKHDRAHPSGGTWGGHLVRLFHSVVPGGPVHLVGAPLPDFADLPNLDDPREGPAAALRLWAASDPPSARRWWVLACDQPRWTEEAFAAWLAEAEGVDDAWALVVRDGHRQPLGGFLPSALLPALARSDATSLRALMAALPASELSGEAWVGEDIDAPGDLAAFDGRR